MAIKLTEVERRILANQELILAKLYPEEKWHLNHAKVYEYGFSTEYEEVLNINKDGSSEAYKETLNILNMFTGIYNIKHTAEKNGTLKDISKSDLHLIEYE
ncbi:MAG: YfbU family protein [bacterium]|nr:YfbU family protein [bacterium]